MGQRGRCFVPLLLLDGAKGAVMLVQGWFGGGEERPKSISDSAFKGELRFGFVFFINIMNIIIIIIIKARFGLRSGHNIEFGYEDYLAQTADKWKRVK